MNDNELLGLAAKAAGYNVEIEYYGPQRHGKKSSILGEPPVIWNPLANDWDALRMAVALRMTIETCPDFSAGHWCVVVVFDGREQQIVEYCEQGEENLIRATRRAIVRAAAEIGRSK